MDLNRFVTLQTVVDEGSFVRAAHKLCCTQSTISYHIRELEQELSIQLFEKIGRRMVLTEMGRTVLPMARDLAQTMENIHRAIQPGVLGGELELAMGETLLAYIIPPILKRFKEIAPHVRLSLHSLNCYSIIDRLLAGRTDMGVFYRLGEEHALIMEDLATFPLVLVAAPQLVHSLQPDFMRPNQRLPFSLVINEQQCIYRMMVEQTLRQRHIVLSNVIELWSIESIKQCVAGGLGISYLPRFCVEHELAAGMLQELPLHATAESITAVCAYHPNKCLSPGAQAFLGLLRQLRSSAALASPAARSQKVKPMAQ